MKRLRSRRFALRIVLRRWPAWIAAAVGLGCGIVSAALLYHDMAAEYRPTAFTGRVQVRSLLFVYWVLSPGLGGAMFAWWTRYNAALARVALAGVLITFGLSVPMVLEGIELRPDPQGIMALAFMPLLQWLGMLLTFATALGIRAWVGGVYRSASPLVAVCLGLGMFFISMLAVIGAISLID